MPIFHPTCSPGLLASILTVLTLIGHCLGAPTQAASDSPWPGPQGQAIFMEAEAFDIQGQGWSILPDDGKRNTPAASGRRALSGAESGDGVAVIQRQVTQAGQYHLWIRHAQFDRPQATHRGPFRVTVAQQGEILLDQVIDAEHPNAGLRHGGPVIPPYVWHKAVVQLKSGPVRITLSKSGSGRINPHTRKIDCLLLTDDLAYEADDRDWAPQTYLRITLDRANAPAVHFQCFVNHMRAPFYERAVFDAQGSRDNAMHSTGKHDLAPGENSQWINISRLLDGGWDSNITITAAGRNTPAGRPTILTDSAYTLTFASAPREDAIVKTLRRDGPGAGMIFRIGSHAGPDSQPRSDLEIAQETKAMVDTLPPVAFGRRPTRFPVMTEWRAQDQTHTPGTEAVELQIMDYLGLNANANWPLTQRAVDSGILFTRAHLTVFFRGQAGYSEPKVDIITRQLENRARQYSQSPMRGRVIQAKLMDEATATPLARLAVNPANQRAFVQWLKDHSYTPQSLGVSSWEQVKLLPHAKAGPAPLYVASQRYRAGSIVDFFSLASRLTHEHFDSSAATMQNFSDGAVYMANMYAQGNDYFTWFKGKSLDVAISEDWTALGSTPQCCGWNVALLRAATKYHSQPLGMYVISYGPAIDTKLRAYSDLAQGAKSLNFYAYGPRYQGHEPGWSHRPDTFRAIAEITREIGAAEHVLMDAMPRQARTAIIYSVSSDIWDVTRDNVTGHDRMHTYIAMRHGQVAVDVLSEEDVIEGRLRDYACAYLFGDQLDRQAFAPLAQWVKQGGTLVLSPGAGQRDELNQPTRELDAALAIRRQPVEVMQTAWIYGRGLHPLLKSKGTIKLATWPQQIDLLARRQDIQPGPGSEILARFDDGKPASVAQPMGKGKVVMHGFPTAVTYVHQALQQAGEPSTPTADEDQAQEPGLEDSMSAEANRILAARASQIPTRFNEALREFILAPARQAVALESVTVDTPLIEATYMQGSQGWVVPLANYSGQPCEKIEVTIHVGSQAFTGLTSSRLGALVDLDDRPDFVRVRLPLASTDMIHATWADAHP